MWGRAQTRIVIATVAAVLAVGLCAGADAAGALTFGSDLSQAPNAPLSCGEGVLNQFLGQFIIGPFNGSCTWSSVVVGSSAESLTAPASGTVTAVHVRAGASTGPMQVDVIRFLFRQTGEAAKPELACCFVQAYGPVFTPTANAITTIQTNLPVKVDPTPAPADTSTIAATDQLALSSLDPSVQVPLFATAGGASDLKVLSYAWYPAPSSAAVAAPSPNPIGGFADLSGFKVLMSADLDTGGGGAPATGGGPGGGAPNGGGGLPAPMIALPTLSIPIHAGTAAVPIRCLVQDCRGLIALQSARPARAAGATHKQAAKLLSYGSARFFLRAGTTGKVKVKLSAAGRKLVKAHSRSKVWANVRFSAGGGAPTSTRLTLKR
jgi:hypothetical protein